MSLNLESTTKHGLVFFLLYKKKNEIIPFRPFPEPHKSELSGKSSILNAHFNIMFNGPCIIVITEE